MHICNLRTQYGMGLAQIGNIGCSQHFVFFMYFCVTFMPAPRVFSARTCVCFANNKFFSTIQQVTFLKLDKFENNF